MEGGTGVSARKLDFDGSSPELSPRSRKYACLVRTYRNDNERPPPSSQIARLPSMLLRRNRKRAQLTNKICPTPYSFFQSFLSVLTQISPVRETFGWKIFVAKVPGEEEVERQ